MIILPITYGLHRTGTGGQSFLDHLILPVIFLGKQIGILIPFFIMFLFAISKFKIKINFKDQKLLFLLIINIVPILINVCNFYDYGQLKLEQCG